MFVQNLTQPAIYSRRTLQYENARLGTGQRLGLALALPEHVSDSHQIEEGSHCNATHEEGPLLDFGQHLRRHLICSVCWGVLKCNFAIIIDASGAQQVYTAHALLSYPDAPRPRLESGVSLEGSPSPPFLSSSVSAHKAHTWHAGYILSSAVRCCLQLFFRTPLRVLTGPGDAYPLGGPVTAQIHPRHRRSR